MNLIIPLLVITTVMSEEYFRPLYSYDTNLMDIADSNIKYNFIDRSKLVEDIDPENCDQTGCKLNFEKLITGFTDKSFGVTFDVNGMGLNNKTIEIYTSDITFDVEVSYVYSTLYCKPFYNWVLRNYDSESYDKCLSNSDDLEMVSASGEVDTKIWKTAASQKYKKTVQPYSSDSAKCNHYWLTPLDICMRKSMKCKQDSKIIVFKLSNEATYDMTLVIEMDKQKYPVNIKSDFVESKTIQVSDVFSVEVQPSASLVNPLNGYLLCYSLTTNKTTAECDGGWYYTENVPAKGNLPVDGLGKYQLVPLNNIEELLYDKSIIKWDGSLTSCGSDKINRFANKRQAKSVHHDSNSLANIFYSDNTMHKKVPINATEMNVGYTKNDDSCCVYMSGSSDNFLDNIVKNYQKFDDKAHVNYPIKIKDFKLDVKGYPELSNIKYKKLFKSTYNLILYTKDLYLTFNKEPGTITDLKIKTIVNYKSGAGSYLEYEYF